MPLPEVDSYVRAEIFGTSAHLDIPRKWLSWLFGLHGSRRLGSLDFDRPIVLGMAKDAIGIAVFRREKEGEGVLTDVVVLDAARMRSVFGSSHPLLASWKTYRSRRMLSDIIFRLQPQNPRKKKS